jgi:hypothetical protein
LLTMTQDHRTSQESLAVQASRATGAPAGQRPAPGPCGPVARLASQPSTRLQGAAVLGRSMLGAAAPGQVGTWQDGV